MKTIIALIILFLRIYPANAYADYDQRMQAVNQQLDQVEEKKTSSAFFRDQESSFSINEQTFYTHYSEPDKARKVMGVWSGVEGKYVYRPPQGGLLNTPVFNYYAIEGLYANGNNRIDENEQRVSDDSITKLVIRKIPGYMFDNRVLLGKDYIASSLRLTPYTGLGIRYETDHAAGSYTDYDTFLGSPVVVLGYNSSNLYYYIPIGFTLDMASNKNYEVDWNMEYDYIVKGYQRDDYANFDQFTLPADGFTNQNLKYSLRQGWGFRSSLKFIEHISSSVDIYFEPYMRYWHVNTSKAASGSVDDANYIATANKNSTLEVGSSIGVKFY